MNMRASKLSLEQQCMQALRELPDEQGITDAQRDLYERLCSLDVDDVLAWEEQADDVALAEELWKQLSKRDGLSIQSAAIAASLRSLRAVAACPIDGYI